MYVYFNNQIVVIYILLQLLLYLIFSILWVKHFADADHQTASTVEKKKKKKRRLYTVWTSYRQSPSSFLEMRDRATRRYP